MKNYNKIIIKILIKWKNKIELAMKVGLLMEKKKVLGYGDLVEENFFKECLKEIKFMGKAFFKVI